MTKYELSRNMLIIYNAEICIIHNKQADVAFLGRQTMSYFVVHS